MNWTRSRRPSEQQLNLFDFKAQRRVGVLERVAHLTQYAELTA